MIPDVTPNGVFYLPPTGWLTSFYNPPSQHLSKEVTTNYKIRKAARQEEIHRAVQSRNC